MENYETILSLVKNRRTPRLVTTDNIPPLDILKIKDAISYAPSFDKVYPYSVYFLTNTPEAIAKKKELLQYYRCAAPDGSFDSYGDTFHNKEMNQALLSGLVIAYVSRYKKSTTGRYFIGDKRGEKNAIRAYALKDLMISASYAMMGASALGYHTGMFGSMQSPDNAAKLFINEKDAKLEICVTVAKTTISTKTPEKVRQYFNYGDQKPYVIWNKHLNQTPTIDVNII